MEINLDLIKAKVLEETKEEREKILDIDTKHQKMYNERRKRYKRITYYACLTALACTFLAIENLINWQMIPIIIALLLLGFAFADTKFMRYCSGEILKESEILPSLKKISSEKKNKILQEDRNMANYLDYLKNETTKAILEDFDYYSTCMKYKDEVERERRRLTNEIKSSFPKQESLLLFTPSFENLVFEFSREFYFKWGDGLEHTKICKISAYGQKISFRSYSYYPSYF